MAFTEPIVPLVLTFLSVRPVTGLGVEQAAIAMAAKAMKIYDLIMTLSFTVGIPVSVQNAGQPGKRECLSTERDYPGGRRSKMEKRFLSGGYVQEA